MPRDPWTSVMECPDRVLAEAIREVLAGAKIPCYIASNEFIPGLGTAFSIRVPSALLPQAKQLLAQPPVSEGELTELALSAPSANTPDT